MQITIVPALGILLTLLVKCTQANLSLDFRVTKITASPANCNVANTTYAHGETFKLDCKTQCVCENGRHACSSLCPKEQLPAPEDTISCRSPRLVEVPGHCCKMWLCENPTADVFATCHNSSTSPWTPCSRPCGLGISTRFTSTAAGCNQLSNLRLCENRKCEEASSPSDVEAGDNNNQEYNNDEHNNSNNNNSYKNNINRIDSDESAKEYVQYLTKSFKNSQHRNGGEGGGSGHQHHKHNGGRQHHEGHHHKHTIKKGHNCRHIERLGPARIRLGHCVSRKLYRPKVCGHCHHKTKCCVPAVSTTIQVELLCPLNAVDPISLVQHQLNSRFQTSEQHLEQQQQQQQFYEVTPNPSSSSMTLSTLWDTRSLDAIDQEYLQSHQIHIENKFIAVEWILKCVCSESDNCERIGANDTKDHSGRNENNGDSDNDNNNRDSSNHHHRQDNSVHIAIATDTVGRGNENNNDKRNNEKYNKINMQNVKNNNKNSSSSNNNSSSSNNNGNSNKYNNNFNNDDDNYFGLYGKINKKHFKREHLQHIDDEAADADAGNTDADVNLNVNANMNVYVDVDNNNDSDNDSNSDTDINSIAGHNRQTNRHNGATANKHGREEVESWPTSSLSLSSSLAANSDESQPDIIPYPPPPFRANKQTATDGSSSSNNSNSDRASINNNSNNPQYILDNNTSNNSEQNMQDEELQQQQSIAKRINDNYQLEREQQRQQQQQYFYEQWLLQQQQQERQQALYEQLMVT